MATNFSFQLFILFLGSLPGFISAATATHGGENTINMNYVGTIDGKSFFADMTQNMTWKDSKDFCLAKGMTLATITSNEQKELLINGMKDNMNDHFWTGGRDAQLASQMVWDSNGRSLGATISLSYLNFTDILTCLTFHPTQAHTFHGHLCAEKYGIICEIVL